MIKNRFYSFIKKIYNINEDYSIKQQYLNKIGFNY